MCKNTSPLERVNFALFPQISDCSKRINLRLPSDFDYTIHLGKYTIPSDPNTMKDEGFEPSKYGL